jgi:hypothetical protein
MNRRDMAEEIAQRLRDQYQELRRGGVLVAPFAASWPPARRAMRVDPMTALRTE